MVFQKAVYHKRVLEPLLKCHNDDTRESHDQFTSLLNRGCTVKLFTEKTVRISGGGGSISKKKMGLEGLEEETVNQPALNTAALLEDCRRNGRSARCL